MTQRLHILALSGSLRAASSNTALLDAARLLQPDGVAITRFESIGGLPHFDPDLDQPGQALPPSVAALRSAVGASDGLLIAGPEYAHGIPGSFKNALDWLVGGPEFLGKPIMIVHATPRGTHARAALHEVLTTMSGVVAEATFTLPLLGRITNPEDIAANPDWASVIRSALERFAVEARR